MNVFAFGLGYSALHFLRTRRAGLAIVAGTVRSPQKVAALAREGIEAFVFSPEQRDPAVLDRLAKAQALLISIPPGFADPVLEQFGSAIAQAPLLEHIAYLSTVGVYGDHGADWVDEATVPAPTSQRGRERLTAEAGWLGLGMAARKALHVLRLGGIYGPGRNTLMKLREGTAHRLVKPGQVFNRIHVEDIAAAIAACLDFPGPGEIWNVVDDEPAPPQDVVAYAAKLLGIEPPPEVPFDAADVPIRTRSFYSENKRVSNGKMKRKLGVRLAYPTYREGLAALVREA
jgi:nucleoside-diphosphate-sugar epimerase